MKIKKLLKIILVAPSYIVVENNGENMRIQLSSTEGLGVGEMYEYEEKINFEKSDEKEIESPETSDVVREESKEDIEREDIALSEENEEL